MFTYEPPSWELNSLTGFISEQNVKDHLEIVQNYVNKINDFAKKFPTLNDLSLAEIVGNYSGAIQNTAAQILNHNFFWKCLSPNPNDKFNISNLEPFNLNPSEQELLMKERYYTLNRMPGPRLTELLNRNFNSVDRFVNLFSDMADKHFGSGWIWLVYDPRLYILELVDGQDAYNPILDGNYPLLVLDVWEHSYYLDYQWKRPEYVKNFWKYVNWNFIEDIVLNQVFGPTYKFKES